MEEEEDEEAEAQEEEDEGQVQVGGQPRVPGADKFNDLLLNFCVSGIQTAGGGCFGSGKLAAIWNWRPSCYCASSKNLL